MATAVMPPQPIRGPEVWTGADLARSTDWIRRLSDTLVAELDTAQRAVERRGLGWHDIRREDFPLPTAAAELAAVSHELEHGRGIVLLRGLPVERYTEDQLRRLYWGLGTHLGVARYQNAHGELLGEVRDEVRLYGEVYQPGVAATEGVTSRAKARTAGPLRWHTDRCDVVSLLCVRNAQRGGMSRVASVPAIHNALLERRPDLDALLFQDYVRTRQGEEFGGEASTYALPVWAIHQGRFTTQYSRTFVEAAQKVPGVPRLAPAQDEALDQLAIIADELGHEHPFTPGDIQLLNNHVVYHGRTAYADAPEPGQDRFLLRLWLATPNSRALPPGFEVLWGSTAAGAERGGIEQRPS